MKRPLLAAIPFFAALAANAQTSKEEKHFKELVAKAEALPMRKCELNDGKKAWALPNREPMGDLPVYRCTAEDTFGETAAFFTQIPDGSVQKEAVELCTFGESSTKCETVAADRPAHRTADLAKYGVKARQFEPIRCENTSVGTLPMAMCSKPRAKQEHSLLRGILGKK